MGDTLAIGPSAEGDFDTVVIKDIHRNRTPIRVAKAGQIVTFAIDYSEARRGMCLCPVEASALGQTPACPSCGTHTRWRADAGPVALAGAAQRVLEL